MIRSMSKFLDGMNYNYYILKYRVDDNDFEVVYIRDRYTTYQYFRLLQHILSYQPKQVFNHVVLCRSIFAVDFNLYDRDKDKWDDFKRSNRIEIIESFDTPKSVPDYLE